MYDLKEMMTCCDSCQASYQKESQQVKNHNVSWLIANLGRLIGQVNATVFIVFQRCLLFYNSKKYPGQVAEEGREIKMYLPALRRLNVERVSITCEACVAA